MSELWSKIIKTIYSFVYRKWLWNEHSRSYDKVLEVKGWRTARIETKSGQRYVTSPCFKILGIRFD